MQDFEQTRAVDIEVPKPVEVPQSPVPPEILPPQELPIPLTDPPPPVVEARISLLT